MNPSVSDLFLVLKTAYPLELCESFDNVGLLAGKTDSLVTKVLISLDITAPVIEEAHDLDANLIVSHHPLIFGNPLRAVTNETETGRLILSIIEKNMSAICMHTNADAAEDGVSDALAGSLGLKEVVSLGGGDSGQIGRVGTLEAPMPFFRFSELVKSALSTNGLRVAGSGQTVYRVAVGGGACGNMIPEALRCGADTLVTSDVRYHQFQEAAAFGINLIDAGHFATENGICQKFMQCITRAFPALPVIISQANHDPVFFL